ncbi:MAG: prolyl oligopeptidase family serine peptidase [Neisseriaceae bacterium]|nr:prolyl oligopeptidase family serine peptidase [Neisseriaceae bacterium]
MQHKILLLFFLFVFQATFASDKHRNARKHQESNCYLENLNEGVKRLNCPSSKVQISYTNPLNQIEKRDVVYQLPKGTAPKGGWPVVFIYQGTGYFAPSFSSQSDAPFANYHRTELITNLLDNGYAVIAPSARFHKIWETSMALTPELYEKTNDYYFLKTLFEKVASGDFGPINPQVQFATGISSGGYNTSRMAISFPGQFKALAIQSGSYATCFGPACIVPKQLPKNHPPTLLLHGGKDIIVPEPTAQAYYRQLKKSGITTEIYVEPSAGHQWLSSSPERIVNWFNQYKEGGQ